ncbi:hypothetical protein PYW08_012365 [Mythimna loreyi]|uniref:Uncharacterized protein n=1 Tax=Mythimna loreyi TaxID=667449 RepID=A0ACC2Q2E2_9NEOP|nr:hypothetical protein PYW08_012365 [Mythimna loreyi]
MFSNISYFSKSGDQPTPEGYVREPSNEQFMSDEPSQSMDFQSIEPDSTSKHYTASLKLPESVKKFAVKKGSLSDTDLHNIEVGTKSRRTKTRNLKLDIRKASQSMNESLSQTGNAYIENTPTHISLECKSADLFSQKFKQLHFSQSFDFDLSSESEEEIDIESLSECSDTDISVKEEEQLEVKMCRKVESRCENRLVPSTTPESFGDVELDRNEEERISLLLNYQMKFEKVECVLQKLLSEFQFHIEVSKIFNCRSIVTALPGTDVSNIPKMLGQVTYMDNVKRESPTESWNIIMEKEDIATKYKFRKQLQSLKHCLDSFMGIYLQTQEPKTKGKPMIKRSITFNLHKGKRMHKNSKISNKKRMKHFDFPDYRDAFLNLFKERDFDDIVAQFNQTDDGSAHKCGCNCHNHSLSPSDSGMSTKDVSNQSITSSIGNFSLDSTTLSAYSESLDQIISYNSFDDSTLFNSIQQKPAVERITFYVQVHSIQIRCDTVNCDESKNSISFYCPACDTTVNDEDGLLKHILYQKHCEKLHFLYKSVYINKCVAAGKEIQPSTVLNPMTMYRDDNKIVCFGDAVYACSLCFENNIIGESILMAHCAEEIHAERREQIWNTGNVQPKSKLQYHPGFYGDNRYCGVGSIKQIQIPEVHPNRTSKSYIGVTMLRLLLLLCAVGSVYLVPLQAPPAGEETCGYESCHATPAGMLNVHIVPHTHDDVGWLKTVDQYYYGSRNNIQKAGVQYILDSVIKELWEDPKRRFIYVETAFFWKWWVRQSAAIQQKVRTLVREGRLQMVGGAWSMNDEAAAHYQSTVDQFTWGHRKLNQTFGHCGRPRVGWQIDPFGHAREFASLLAMMGFDGLFLGRIDYQDKRARFANKNMEMVWRGDDVLGKSSDIFTGVLHNTYSPPPGFCFDVLCSDEPIIDDPTSPLYNVENKIAVFLDYVKNQARYYRSNNVIITMGGDFTYQDAAMWYINLDKLIEYANLKAAKDGLNITLFYSTPNCYLKAIKDANPTLPTKHDDFFPYASDSTAYWTGYFTSRPTTKYFEREGNNYLQVVKQLQVLSDLEKHNQFVLDELKSAMGVMQHHDAITGTEKQHVTHDYERLLNQALDDALIVAKQAFNKMTVKDATKPPLFDFQRCHLNESRCYVSENSAKFVVTIYNPLGWSVKEPIRIPVGDGAFEVYGSDGKQIKTQMVPLPQKVKSIPTRFSKATQEILFIIDLKPLSYKNLYVKKTSHRAKRNLKKGYDFYVNNNNNWDPLKEPIINRLDDRIKDKNSISDKVQAIPYAPVFSEDVSNEDRETNLDILKDGQNDDEVLELERFLTENRKKKEKKEDRMMGYPSLSVDELRMLSDEPRTVEKHDDELELGNQFYKLDVNTASGLISEVTFPDHTTLNLSINMYYYTGSCGDNHDTSHRASGAYIFRPVINTPIKLSTQKTEVINGDLVKEFRVNLSPAGFINTKLYDSLNFIETEWIVGPIPITDDLGKEYIIKYETNIINNGEFYTDSNGRQMLKRKLDFRPQWNLSLAEPIPGNYYPVTNEIYIENEDLRLSVLTDRSEGGTSLVEGEVELMLHRRLLCDDAFGVGEALNETANGHGLVARGKHRVIITKDDKIIKKNVLGMHLSPTVLFSDATNIKYEDWLKLQNEFGWLDKDLPNGIHLLTLEPWDHKLLIRFENYLEDDTAEINLKNLFKNIEIKCFKETMLSANMFVEEYNQWVWKKEGGQGSIEEETELQERDLTIKIKPKQIRTFLACFERK